MQAKEYVKEVLRFPGYPKYAYDEKRRFAWYVSKTMFEVRDKLELRLQDMEVRLRDMDKAGIEIQIISPAAPNCESFPSGLGIKLSKINNDYISELATRHPDRFVGLGSLPMQDIQASLEELDRMRSVGLRGIMAPSNVQGEQIDARKYWPLYQRAEDLGFPVFVHPSSPANSDKYEKYQMWGPVFGFGADVALSALRLIMSGVLEEFPRLRIILGHLGETIPFILKRIDFAYLRTPEALPAIKKRPSEYFLANFYVDTAGVFHQPSLQCTYETLGRDRILFGSDYPFENATSGVKFIQGSKIPAKDKERIYSKNVGKLLGLPA